MNLISLNILNFFIADVRDGLGPFLAVFLQQHQWEVDQIGLVMTISSLTGMVATTPISTLADIIRSKRTIIVISAMIIIFACSLNYFYPVFYTTISAQILTAIAGAAIPPTVNAITLGLVGQKQFDYQLGQNESYNHGGNAFSAMVSGIFSFYFGLKAVFILMVIWTFFSLISILFIPAKQINYQQARGLNKNNEIPQPLVFLFNNKTLFILILTVTLFHLANAAMLPLLSQAMIARGTAGNAGAYTALTIIIAQLTMIPMALLAARLAQTKGYKLVFIFALMALPIRGLLAGLIQHPYVVLPVQVLDGVGAGLMGVAVPGLVVRILNGSGRINTGLGIVMTAQGIGAALSPYIAGIIAKHYQYHMAFLFLSFIAAIALLIWITIMPSLNKA
ncbi:MFS transporter [Commensalibacter oyaizuii]|uniref:MFS transporter n=1 Tax=Commensalibacter oyaizuii TaxID=3043873 RepID=A0ABT6Q0L6_9PROT|nr:MFS transporter [Commensalibacter sp. TBRC 16381]MDI2090642.1 MFS transporter [Commensalibacter sp. TBRC 16381]